MAVRCPGHALPHMWFGDGECAGRVLESADQIRKLETEDYYRCRTTECSRQRVRPDSALVVPSSETLVDNAYAGAIIAVWLGSGRISHRPEETAVRGLPRRIGQPCVLSA